MELFINFYQQLPAIVRVPVDFIFSVVIVRGIIARELSDFIRDRWVQSLSTNPRKDTIWSHYQDGHGQALALCQSEQCASL